MTVTTATTTTSTSCTRTAPSPTTTTPCQTRSHLPPAPTAPHNDRDPHVPTTCSHAPCAEHPAPTTTHPHYTQPLAPCTHESPIHNQRGHVTPSNRAPIRAAPFHHATAPTTTARHIHPALHTCVPVPTLQHPPQSSLPRGGNQQSHVTKAKRAQPRATPVHHATAPTTVARSVPPAPSKLLKHDAPM